MPGGALMDPVQLVLDGLISTLGSRANYDKSQGIAKYTADNADDGMAKTIHREQASGLAVHHHSAHAVRAVENLAGTCRTIFRD